MKPRTQFTHETYLSPFTWRYGFDEMRAIWSEEHKRRLHRRVWVALAAAQHRAGLVAAGQLADLRAHQDNVDLARAAEIVAETRPFAGQRAVGGPIRRCLPNLAFSCTIGISQDTTRPA